LQVQKTLRNSEEKYKVIHDQQKIERMVRVGEKLWIQLNKEWLQGPCKKIKDLYYHPFYILEKVGDNSCKPSIPPYMWIYSVVVVENLKLYDPSMLDQEEE